MFFLGIDGGGTRCRARIRDEAGRLLGEGTGGRANIHQDFAGSVRSILEAAAAASGQAGVSMPQLNAGLGLAGVETLPGLEPLRAALPFAAVTAINDAPAACLGAHGGCDGGVVIAGTGSAGCAIVEGKTTVIGGWGFELGDDGSGAIMGRAAVRAAVASIDGLGLDTPFTRAILYQIGDDRPALSQWVHEAKPADYAEFAPDVFDFSDRGDPVANGILMFAAQGLQKIAERLISLGAPKLALVGGLREMYLAGFSNFREMFAHPQSDALDGAIMAARAAAGLPMAPPS